MNILRQLKRMCVICRNEYEGLLELYIENCPNITNISNIEGLECLTISNCNNIINISNIEGLEWLNITNCKNYYNYQIYIYYKTIL